MIGVRMRRALQRRSRYLAALALVLVVGVALIVVALFTEEFARDVLINVGASVVGVFLTAVALEPLIERGRRPEEVIHAEFPHERFIDAAGTATRRVRVMGAWPYVMDTRWRQEFLDALARSLARGVRVEILVLDPTSSAAAQRSADLDHRLDASGIISEVLDALSAFATSDAGARVAVRVYSTLPPARLYRWDDRAISSFFPSGTGLGTDVRHYETSVTTGLGGFVDEQFDALWDRPDTVELADFLHVELRLVATGTVHRCAWVEVDDVVFAIGPELVVDLFRRRDGDVTLERRTGTVARVRPVAVAEEDPRVQGIETACVRKYGPADPLAAGFRGVVELASAD